MKKIEEFLTPTQRELFRKLTVGYTARKVCEIGKTDFQGKCIAFEIFPSQSFG